MRNTLFFLAGAILLLVQENLFRVMKFVPVAGVTPSLVLPLILFMGVHEYNFARGAFVAFMLGYLTDLMGIAPVGIYSFSYVALFLLARAAGVRLAAQTTMMRMALALVFTVVQSVMVLVLLAIFGKDAYVPRALYPMIIPHALSTALVSPFVFQLAQRIDAATAGAARALGAPR